jgi:hypothetical protein
MIPNWYKEDRHQDFNDVTDLYPARCDAFQPTMWQSIEYVHHGFDQHKNLLGRFFAFGLVPHEIIFFARWIDIVA